MLFDSKSRETEVTPFLPILPILPMDATRQMAIFDGFLVVMGLIFLAVGLRARSKDALFARSGVRGIAKVVEKQVKVIGVEDPTEVHYLMCVLLEGGKPASNVVKVQVASDAWNSTEIDQEIEVYHVNGEFSDIHMRPVSGAPQSGTQLCLLIGVAFLVFAAYRILQDLHS